MKRIAFLLFISIFVFSFSAHAKTIRNGFAIVVDPQSLHEAQTEINQYKQALAQVQGFHVYVVEDKWGIPDSIRAALIKLYNQKFHPIAGAVFMGDIPVPMIRDAQYLTSAFKMNQKQPWEDSSIPSDRFYDDFGLEFDFLKKDSLHNWYYYSLSEKGDQFLAPSIFSGRIRPTDADGTSKYEKLRLYLKKAIAAKYHPEKVTSVFVYTGSGSLNESKVAHIDEMKSMEDHFPMLKKVNRSFRYMDYSEEPYIKTKLMNQMMQPDLSIGIMQHHGDFDTQYLSSYPLPKSMAEAKAYIMRSCVNRLRMAKKYGKNVDSTRLAIIQNEEIPAEWLTEANIAYHDSLETANTAKMNLTLPDFPHYKYQPNCRIAIYDACYNGVFHQDNSIANEYIFQPGKTMVGIGGSVNVLQDKWPDKLIGLFAEGVMAGYINMYNMDLETHVVGDPTYVFQANGKQNLNYLLANGTDADWKKLLSATMPDVRILAMEKLAKSKVMSNDYLLNVIKNSACGIERLEAFLVSQKRRVPNMTEALNICSNDNFELLERFAINAMVKNGSTEVLPGLLSKVTAPTVSARVAFNAEQGLQFFPGKEVTAEYNKQMEQIKPFVVEYDAYKAKRDKQVQTYVDRWEEDVNRLCSDSMSDRRALLQADFMKIYCPAYLAPDVMKYIENLSNENLQIQLLSSMGWHWQAFTSQTIMETALCMSNNAKYSEPVRQEALRTYKRIRGIGYSNAQ